MCFPVCPSWYSWSPERKTISNGERKSAMLNLSLMKQMYYFPTIAAKEQTGASPYLCRMEQLLEQIETYRKEIAALNGGDAAALESYRIRFLGTKGIVKSLFSEMKNVPAENRKEF